MAEARLTAVVSTVGAQTATRELNSLTTSSSRAAKAALGLASAYVSVASAVSGVNKLVTVTRQFDILNSRLKTAVGGAENASIAFAELQRFASETPFALEQSVDAFTKLVNLGLDPSEKALISFGNTASAMGKDLNQLIAAVADAATGEFERLKDFGIKARSQGEEVSFTFAGVTTTVGKNATEIQRYLTELGDNNFAGAMADRVDTLDGAISNLEDQWDSLFRTVSSMGAGDLIESSVRGSTAAIKDLESSLASGQIGALLDANFSRFLTFGDDVSAAFSGIYPDFKALAFAGGETADFLTDAFTEFPENIRAAIQIATVEIASLIDKAKVQAESIKSFLTFGDPVDTAKRFAEINEVREQSIVAILGEREAALDSFSKQVDAADQLKVKFDEINRSRPKSDLSQFGVGPSVSGPSVSEKDEAQKQLDAILSLNNSELEAIRQKEDEKSALLQSYREKGILSETEYFAALREVEINSLTQRSELRDRELEDQKARFEEQNAIAIQSGELVSESIAQNFLDVAKGQATAKDAILGTIGAVSDMIFKSLAQQLIQQQIVDRVISAGFVKQKTAEASTSAAQAAQNAFTATSGAPYPLNLYAPTAAAAAGKASAALGAGVVSAASAREQGGSLAAGQSSTVAERGQLEILTPASNSRVRTAQQMKGIMGDSGGGSPQVSLVVIDQSTGSKEFEQSTDDDGRIILLIRSTVSSDFGEANSQISKSLGANTNAQRAGR